MENLSPEERLKLIKDNCIFCKIINKEIESYIVFEDDKVLAILDINPATKGHLLLMPKEHYMIMQMVPDEELSHLTMISKYLSDLLIQTFDAKDVTIYIANGAAAGQQSTHFMIHLIPRYENDGIDFDKTLNELKIENKYSQKDLEEISEDIKKTLIELNENLKNN
jgi:histidine triad (HIT) family protein